MSGAVRDLVIGYGNRWRGDDAVGPLVAEAVAGWGERGVEAIVVRQLLPELAPQIAQARRILFVDASEVASVTTGSPLLPAPASRVPGHLLSARDLLGWTVALFGMCPPAWLLTIPARRFETGAALSPEAQAGVRSGLEWLRRWLDEVG